MCATQVVPSCTRHMPMFAGRNLNKYVDIGVKLVFPLQTRAKILNTRILDSFRCSFFVGLFIPG